MNGIGISRWATLALGLVSGCGPRAAVETHRAPPDAAALARQCREVIGEPRIERLGDAVRLAIGYDLANTILIHTSEGNVVVDVSMSPTRARAVKEALQLEAPGPTRAIVYTHSHIDHVGGASVWLEEGTEIWATEAFTDHLIKQYGLFRAAESVRGARQFGRRASEEFTDPCSALGRLPDFNALRETGLRMPTRTFSGRAEFVLGGTVFQLIEAHGETHDQLMVWLPQTRTLLPGDNYYHAFPNLYTIRGTQARPVDEWIRSLDAMRRLQPEWLIPSHTSALRGSQTIRKALTDYRDAIQWVRDAVVRGANAGLDLDTIASQAALPHHLATQPALEELYGQLDWSARGIYTSALGWFDGRPENLYPLPAEETARREIQAMGGKEKVLEAAARSIGSDPAWALHLLAKLERGGLADDPQKERIALLKARALRGRAAGVSNTNGRSYLVESAIELEEGLERMPLPRMDEAFLTQLPLAVFFDIMATRLKPEAAMDVHETVRFDFTDSRESAWVTIRRGVAEIVWSDPLPDTPPAAATATTDSLTWRRLALQLESPAGAVARGRLKVDGWPAFLSFMGRFEREG